jgi:potassium-transporting ATPase KdpC subunit
MLKHFTTSIRILFVFTLLTGILYPVAITVIAQAAMPDKANGSLVKKDGKIIGSSLIAQNFKSQKYFFGRPSAVDYATVPSGASNLGFTSKDLAKAVSDRKAALAKLYPEANGVFPAELLFASGSGLDPHISVEAAKLQLDRIAKTRNYNADQKKLLAVLVEKNTEKLQFGIFGEERVNVFTLNTALDEMR